MSENSLSPNTVWRKCTEGGEGTMTAFVERLTENSHTPRLSSAEGFVAPSFFKDTSGPQRACPFLFVLHLRIR